MLSQDKEKIKREEERTIGAVKEIFEMLNIDSDEEGHFLTSCAGGMSLNISIPVSRTSQTGTLVELTVGGLEGGHSGGEIHKEHGNADIIMGRLLKIIMEATPFGIVKLEGGLKDNAISAICGCLNLKFSGK